MNLQAGRVTDNRLLAMADIPKERIIPLWVDDCRPAPENYYWAKTVNEVVRMITEPYWFGQCWLNNSEHDRTLVLDLDHDAGEYASQGGDYIRILDWMEELQAYRSSIGLEMPDFRVRIHSMNPVGVQNMRNIIKKNRWREI